MINIDISNRNNISDTRSAHQKLRRQQVTISVDYRFTPTLKKNKHSGANVMFNSRKGNSFILFDCGKDSTEWFIVTNNKRFDKAQPYTFFCGKNPNLKYRIGKCLFYFLKIQTVIPYRYYTKKFNRIRQLLIEKHAALMTRIKKNVHNNRQTCCFNKFSYHTTTFYLGYYIPCKECRAPCAIVLSRKRFSCLTHIKSIITTPIPPLEVFPLGTDWGPPYDKVTLFPNGHVVLSLSNEDAVNHVTSKRLKVSYDKVLQLSKRPRQILIRHITYENLDHLSEHKQGLYTRRRERFWLHHSRGRYMGSNAPFSRRLRHYY